MKIVQFFGIATKYKYLSARVINGGANQKCKHAPTNFLFFNQDKIFGQKYLMVYYSCRRLEIMKFVKYLVN